MSISCNTFLFTLTLLNLTGCSYNSSYSPPTLEPIADIPATAPSGIIDLEPLSVAPPSNSGLVTTFNDALRLTKERSPRIKSYQATVLSKEGLVEQAKVFNKNPEILIQPENFSGDLGAVSRSETAVLISKILETGGKRERRVALAVAEQELQKLQTQIAMADLLIQLRKEFIRLNASQELKSIAASQLKIAQDQVGVVQQRVNFGAARPSELSKAKVVQENAKLDLLKIENEILLGRKQLATYWGGSEQDLGVIAAFEEPVVTPVTPTVAQTEKSLSFNQSLLESAVKKCKVAMEEANRYPDLRASFGMRHLQETHENTFLGELSVPLPILDTNSGAVASAQAEATAAVYEAKQKRIEILSKSIELHQTFQNLAAEHSILKNTILKESKIGFEEVKAAYNQGKASYFEVLDAQRTLADVQTRSVETRTKMEETKLDLFGILLDHSVNFDGEQLP